MRSPYEESYAQYLGSKIPTKDGKILQPKSSLLGAIDRQRYKAESTRA